MPLQSAYDTTQPNLAGRFPYGTRVVSVFRLYRKLTAPALGEIVDGTSVLAPILDPVRDAIRTARTFLRDDVLALQGRVLEHEYQFVLLLDCLDQTPEIRTHFTYTRAGWFIDTPLTNAKGISHWRMAGSTFRTPAYVDGVAVDGDAALKEFAELIDDYFYPPDGRVTADFELYWYNLLNPISAEDPIGEREWLIHPLRHGVQVSQAAHRPFLRRFSFDFAGLQSNRDKAKAEDGFLDGLLAGDFLANLLHALNLDSVAAVLKDVFGVVKEITDFVTDVTNVVTAALDFIRGVTDFIAIGIGKIRGLLTQVQTLIGRVQDGIDLLRAFPDFLSEQWRLLQQSVPGLTTAENGDDLGTEALAELQQINDALLALAAQPRAFVPPALRDLQDSVPVAIEPSTTLEAIAQQYDVTVEELVRANGLQFPFVDARPRVDVQAAAIATDRAAVVSRLSAPLTEGGLLAALNDARARASTDTTRPAAQWAADIASLEQAVASANATLDRLDREATALEQTSTPVTGVAYAGDTLRVPQPRPPGRAPSVVPIHTELAARVTALTGLSPT
ncbi:MAG TPA: LysM domain-containing protein, partial [Mycobacterium sp.]|nr:LysM domain-containing protein [Mycobacterium sp.]